MATILSTNFTGIADGAAWPSPWGVQFTKGGSQTVVGGAGRIYVGNLGNWQDKGGAEIKSATYGNFELLASLKWDAGSIPHVLFRSQGSSGEPSSGYDLQIESGASKLYLANNWTWTQKATSTRTLTAGTWYKVRVRAQGSTLNVRMWDASAAEPTSWDMTLVDTTWAAGRLGFQQAGGGATTGYSMYVDDVVVDDLTVAAPTAVTVAAGQYPTAQDAVGTSSDTVTLTKVTGVTWTVDGVDYPSSGFTGATRVVPFTKGVNTTVTARPESAAYTLTGTSSWNLAFTNITPVSVGAGQVPTVVDNYGTSSDAVILAKVTGVTWTVAGVDHPSSAFTGSAKSVPFSGGAATTVTAKAESAAYTLTGTTSWNLTFTNVTAVSIPSSAYPTAVDNAGTSSDTVTLTKVTGVTWTVDGVDHPSSAFPGATKSVPFTKGVNTTVTARAESAAYVITSTPTSWTLTFTNVTPVSVPPGSVPTAADLDGVAADVVNLTKVTGVTWTVDGVDYPSSGFASSTRTVPFTKGVNTVVTAKAESSAYTLYGTLAWLLTFTDVTPVSIPSGASPVAQDVDGVENDTVILTRVDGVTWTVEGVDYAPSSFAAATMTVPYTKGVNVTVTAKPVTTKYRIVSTPTSWTLAFTNIVPDVQVASFEAGAPPREPQRDVYAVYEPSPLPAGMLYSAYRLNGDGTETPIASSLPLSDVKLTPAPLNAPPAFSWSLEPEYAALKDEQGAPVLTPWSTAIYAIDEQGVVRGAGILKSLTMHGATLNGTMVGWVDYLDKLPWTDAVVKQYGADPAALVRLVWERVQSHRGGNIGLSVDSTSSKVRVGAKVTKTTSQPKPTSKTKTKTTAKQIVATTTVIERRLYTDRNVVTTTTTVVTTNRATKAKTTTRSRRIVTTAKDKKVTTVAQVLNPVSGAVTSSTTTTSTTTSEPSLLVTTVESDEPFILANYATEDLGQVVDELLEVGGLDWREHHTLAADGTVRHRLELGYPRIGRRRTDIAFNLQSNVTDVPDFDVTADDYASEVLVLGAGDGEKMVRAVAADPDASRLRRVKVLKQKGIGRTQTAQTFAKNRAGAFSRTSYDITQLEVVDHPLAPMFSWENGDEVRLTGDAMWAGQVDMWVRIIATTFDPESPHIATLEVVRADKVVD